MRFATAFLAIVVCLISLHEYRQLSDRTSDFEHDMEKTHRLVATTLADAVSMIARHEGLEPARDAVALARRHHRDDLRVRWVCLDDNGIDEPPPEISCDVLNRETQRLTIKTDDAARHVTWVPVRFDGKAGGAIEVSESPEHQRSWSRQHLRDALSLATTTVVGITMASFALGWWLVAIPTRRLRAKAQAVGRGELGPDLALTRRDELGEVAEEMNAMCRQLDAAQKAAAREASARVAAVERLQHADRLATTGRLASFLAHELGTPLNVIEARASLIAEDDNADDATRDSAGVIIECTENVTRLVKQLLTFARPRSLDLDALRLDQVARVVIELLQPLADRRQVSLKLGTLDETPLWADAVLLQQAVVNLTVNAIHACSEGGVVTLHTDVVSKAGPGESKERRWGQLVVVDTGVGMTPDVRESLFEPFFTTRASGEGTGLGLPIVAGILDDHHGFMEVETAPGKGSSFHIFLPIERPEVS